MKYWIVVIFLGVSMLSACGGAGESPSGEPDVQTDENLEIDNEENTDREMIEEAP
ncbi:hypothetical protein J2S78_000268 [Salibacterium salarium]|uniref:hypothetical protein n=1 Tax=Salibacterium salarium TaxID=284579 RepID=UPI00277F1FEE|nr:hypothetical protein [Salibacterium salarium]MDQ0297860.1 hypothetical protein [Salibacterium salarium]